jgi:hypothetical protein
MYEKFCAFAYLAKHNGFYLEELSAMEKSLMEMSPFPKNHKKE